MVFGLFEGRIGLILEKTNFAFGETISGELVLSLKKPKQARQLRVELRATEQRMVTKHEYRAGAYKTISRNESVVVFSTQAIVDGEKLYQGAATYNFQIQVPAQNFAQPKITGTLGTVVNVLQTFSGNYSRLKWELKASLDVPGGIDVSKSMQISVA